MEMLVGLKLGASIRSASMRKEKDPVSYQLLPRRTADREGGCQKVPKGCVPVLVGIGEEAERFVVPVKQLKDPRMAVFLEMAEQEFGYGQGGVIRIPCDADHVRRVLDKIS